MSGYFSNPNQQKGLKFLQNNKPGSEHNWPQPVEQHFWKSLQCESSPQAITHAPKVALETSGHDPGFSTRKIIVHVS